jgi:hypothetical protein
MATPHCPRCDRPVHSTRSIHLACALTRARLWVGILSALLIVALVVGIWAMYSAYAHS